MFYLLLGKLIALQVSEKLFNMCQKIHRESSTLRQHLANIFLTTSLKPKRYFPMYIYLFLKLFQ